MAKLSGFEKQKQGLVLFANPAEVILLFVENALCAVDDEEARLGDSFDA